MKRFIVLIILVLISITMMRASGCKKLADGPVNLSQAVVTTLAGPNIGGSITGVGPLPSFNQPTGVAVDDA
jgi:hypothetical protein